MLLDAQNLSVDTPYWRAVSWLNQPRVQVVRAFIFSFLIAVLALLQSAPGAYIAAALLIFVLVAVIDFNLVVLRNRIRFTHPERVQSTVKPLLRQFDKMLTHISPEQLQFTVMCPDAARRYWLTVIDYKLTTNKERIGFPVHSAGWLTSAIKRDNEILATELSEKAKIDYLDNPVIVRCFEDVSAVMVAPIYTPDTQRKRENLIGVLVIYSNAGENSTLLLDANLKRARILTDQIAPILCYDCLCTPNE